MEHVEYHEFASVFPLLEGDELNALIEDIAEHGLREPVRMFEGKILDGRNRHLACKLARRPCRYVEFAGTADEAMAYVWSENATRRHLDVGTLVACRLSADEMLASRVKAVKEKAKQAKHEGQKSGGRGKKKNSVQPVVPSLPVMDRKTDAKIGKLLGASRETVRQVKAVQERAPELFEQVKAGKLASKRAYRQVVAQEKRKQLDQAAELATVLAAQPRWTLIEQEVRDGLASVRDHHGPARLIFADPPYNIGIDYGDGNEADRLDDEAYMAWVKEWLGLSVECLTDDGSLWVMIGDEYAAEYCVALKSLGLTVRSWIKWYETFGVNCTNKFNRTSRHIFYCVRDPSSYVFHRCKEVTRESDRQAKYGDARANPDGKIIDDVWSDIPRLTGTSDERIPDFPTQLPLKLLQRVVACSTDPGDLVVDPFNGSGTTGAAAIGMGRKYVGIDKSAQWIAIADKRLRAATP